MKSLYARSNDELMEILGLEKPFQARIVHGFLVKGTRSFSDMTSLSKADRERLTALYPSTLSSKVIARSEGESAIKLAIELEDGAVIDGAALKAAGIIKKEFQPVKVLGEGETTKKFTVKVDKVSASAKAKIEAAGGSVEQPC